MPNVSREKELKELLDLVVKKEATDLHISAGRYPTIRVDGVLVPLKDKEILTRERARELSFMLLPPEQEDRFLKEKEIDFSYNLEEKGRFRVNVYYQRGSVSAALRLIPIKIRTLEELNLPPILNTFTRHAQGFVLVVGPSGHGKSTVLAALIDKINHERCEHIITIEDPIEYLIQQDKCLVDQREVGLDTESFHRALRSMFREDADVVMIGEMRDPETIATAVTAAETGHLVFSTLHTNNAAQTVDRIISSFPPEGQHQIRMQLANTILGVVSRRLIPRVGGGIINAVEVMIANSAIRNLIRENKIYQLDLVIETSTDEGMVSLNRSLADLVRRGEITKENAEIYSTDSDELDMLLQR